MHIRLVNDTPGSTFEILLDGHVLATRQLPAAGVKWVTREAHVEQIRLAARNSRKPGKRKDRYRQEPTPSAPEALNGTALDLLNAPVVRIRDLSDYESLAQTA